MSNSKQIKLGTILSYIQVIVNIVVSVLYTPLMLKLLGQSEYGLYNTISSTISSLSILSLGFSGGYIKFFAKYKKNNDEESISKLNGLYLIIFSIIGVISFACGVFLTFNLEYIFSTGLSSKEYSIAKILMWLLTINLSTTFVFSVFTTIINAHEKFVFLKICNIVKAILKPVTGIIVMFLGLGSIGLVSTILIITLIIDFINVFYVFKVINQKFKFGHFEKGIFRSLFRFTIFIAIDLIVNQINFSIDKVFIGRFWGTNSVAIYAIGLTLYEGYTTFSLAISEIFAPRVYKISVNENHGELTKIFNKIGRIQFIILALICSGFIFFGQQFLKIWVGNGFEDAYTITLVLMIPAIIPFIQTIGIDIQRAKNKHKFRSILYLFMALLNIVLSVYLCQIYSGIGSAIGTGVSLFIANGLIMNIYYHKKIGLDIPGFWRNILRVSVGLIIPALLGTVFMLFVNMSSILILLLCIGVYTITYCISMYFISMNSDERRYVKIVLSKLRIIKSK